MVAKPHRKQGKEQRDYCSALEEVPTCVNVMVCFNLG